MPSRDLTAKAHQAGVKVLLSLGGWGWDKQFASIVSKPEAEDRYVKSVMAIVKDNDYDGIDLDWEYPDNEKEVIGFERLTRRFRKELDEIGNAKSQPMFVTMAASSNPGTLKWLGKDFLLETMDWINVMTYDYTGDWTNYAGHHSPLFRLVEAAGRSPLDRALDEIPARTTAASPPIAWRWASRSTAAASPSPSRMRRPKTHRRPRVPGGGYNNLHQLEQEKDWTRIWDDETQNPWLIAPDHKMVIGYDDAESVAAKTEWAMKQGFRGVFFWQIGADLMPDDTNPLQEAVASEARRKRERSLTDTRRGTLML